MASVLLPTRASDDATISVVPVGDLVGRSGKAHALALPAVWFYPVFEWGGRRYRWRSRFAAAVVASSD